MFFSCILFFAESSLAHLGFEEEEWDGVPTVAPQGSTNAVVIYGCDAYSSDSSLPDWWQDVWNEDLPNSIPRYYLENSFYKHGFFGDPVGQSYPYCLVTCPYSGVAVGNLGTVLVTDDLDAWTPGSSGTSKHLYATDVEAGYFATAVGESGAIFGSRDGGRTWEPQSSGTERHLRGVSFCGRYGVAVGASGIVLRTQDYGREWISRDSKTSCHLHWVSYGKPVHMATAVAVGDSGTICRTTNNGWNWEKVSSGTDSALYGVCFGTDSVAFTVGSSGTVLRTTDIGQSWHSVSTPTTNDLYAVHFTDKEKGFVVGASGSAFRTTDGAQTWDTLSGLTTNDLYDVFFTDWQTGLVVGALGTILRTTDSGEHWDTLSSGTVRDLHAVHFTKVEANRYSGGAPFTWNILTKADSVIDFADPKFDQDHDGVVDMVCLMIPRLSGQSTPYLNMPVDSFYTSDVSPSGDTIVIHRVKGIACLIVSAANGVFVPVHEYGHKLGLPDYYVFRDPVRGAGLGSFEPMNSAGFYGRISPVNPWFRSNYPVGDDSLGWLEPIRVTSSRLNQEIQDITSGEVYDLVSDLSSEEAMKGQRFLVTNHQKKSFWEQFWPARGLMIWHVFDNELNREIGGGARRDSRRKEIDLETPHGLWDWELYPPDTIYPDSGHPVSPNPLYGLDSLDIDAATASSWPPLWGGLGSPTCVFRVYVDTVFDAFTNPSSDEYNIDPSSEPVSIQDIASHIAVRNIHLHTGDTTVVRADLIVNRVESDLEAATGRNNATRWVLGSDGETMHLVYVSKGYVYYTTTGQSRIWLPAIPIGEGSFPSLGLDASGNPAVVWLQEGVCNVTPSKLMFRIRGGGGWSDPDTLLSIPEELGPPSFVIDTLNHGHMVYKVLFCDQNGNSAICYGTFDVDVPSLQVTVLDASSFDCGDASIGHTAYLNSVHVVWEKESKIWYNWKDDSGWHVPEDVSEIGNDRSKTPHIEVAHEKVHVVWAFESIEEKDVILYRSKSICDTCSWGWITSPSKATLHTARQPVVVDGDGGLYALWSEIPVDGNQFDIYYAKWVETDWQRQGNLSNTPEMSDYPQALQRTPTSPRGHGPSGPPDPVVVLELVWTDGNLRPFHVAHQRINLDPPVLGGGPQSVRAERHAPRVFALTHPYPSPFTEAATLRYQLPYDARIRLRVYDVSGRLIKSVMDGRAKAGYHIAEWTGKDGSGRDVSAGVYFVRLEAGSFKATEKVMFLR